MKDRTNKKRYPDIPYITGMNKIEDKLLIHILFPNGNRRTICNRNPEQISSIYIFNNTLNDMKLNKLLFKIIRDMYCLPTSPNLVFNDEALETAFKLFNEGKLNKLK